MSFTESDVATVSDRGRTGAAGRRRGPDWTRRYGAPAVAVAAAAAGVAAHGAPTGLGAWDWVLRFALAGGVTLIGARGRRWSWITSSAVVTAVAMAGTPTGWWVALVGLAALLLAAASAFTDRRERLAGAMCAALVVNVGLRLPAHPSGLSAAAAGVAVVMLAASGVRTLRRRQRRLTYLVAGLTGLVALGFAALGTVAVLTARPEAAAGLSAADAGLSAAGSADTATTVSRLQSALDLFAASGREVNAWYARPARLVPVIGQNMHAVSVMVTQGADVLAPAVTLAQTGSAHDLYTRGAVNLPAVSALSAPLNTSRASLTQAMAALSSADSIWNLPPVRSKLATFTSKAAKVTVEESHLSDAVASLPGLLGGDGMRHYLILVQDPSELRGAGGVVGDVGVLSADNGRVHLDSLKPAYSGPYSSTLAGPFAIWADRSGFSPQQFAVDSTFAPDFPTDAQGAEQIFEVPGQPRFDGVISVDPAALAGLLSVTGPVSVPGWPVSLTSSNVEAVFLHDQYLAYDGPSQARLDFLVGAARAIFDRFTSTDLARPSELVRALTPAARQGDLMLYANKSSEQQAFSTLGVNGAMGPVTGDWLEVVTQDGGNDKIDYYLTRSMSYQARYDPGTGKVDADLTVTLHNSAPASGQPQYVIGGPGFRADSGTNHLYVTVYSALRVDRATAGGAPLSLRQDYELGRYSYSGYVDIPAGGTRSVTYHLAGSIDGGSVYHLDFAKQPTVSPDQLSVTVSGAGGWKADRSGNFSRTVNTGSTVNMGFTRQ